MKLKKTIISIFIGAIGMIFSSCEDMFSPEADNTYGEERALTIPQSALGFLNTGYTSLPTTYDFSECATDDAVINDPTSNFIPMVSGAWGPLFDPTSIWSTSYRAIDNINKYLTYAPTIQISWRIAKDDSLYRRRSLGEAYGLRGYHHFLLLRYYGGKSTTGKMLGIPYLKGIVDLDPIVWSNFVRPDYKVTVENIVEDLDSAIKYLPKEYIGTDRVYGIKNTNRLTTWIALAMKAQLYMHAASPSYNGGAYNIAYCDSAIKYSAILIDHIGGTVALSGLLSKDFYSNDLNQTNAEVLWRMNQATEATYTAAMDLTIESKNYPPSRSGKGQVNPTQDFVDAFPALNGYPITDVTKSGYVASNPYLKRDPRLDSCVIRDGGKLGGFIIKTSKDDVKNGIENPGATRTGYYLKKLMRPDFSITNPIAGKKTIRPLMRYTELFLIYAEAATAAHDADWKGVNLYSARTILKAIRKRAGIIPDIYVTTLPSANFMDFVRNERRIELAFEGFRFWDLRRWGLETNVILHRARILSTGGIPEFLPMNDEARNFVNFKYFAPIPNNEILKCPKLEQNAPN